VIYKRGSSPLHAARAAAGISYCAALAVAALVLSNPVLLGALLLTIVLGACAAGVWRQIRRALLLSLPLVAAIIVINALASRDGLTVIVRLGELPILGHTDVTLEATVYGAVLALRAVVLILCGALYTVAVDPDDVLRLFRRVSFRSALTATLATRMVPVLIRDSRRLADAQRSRSGPPPSRFFLLRAATTGVLDRALDTAAALEVRGYGAARRPPRLRRAWSRHDIAFAVSAAFVLLLAVVIAVAGLASFTAYPALHCASGPGVVSLAGALMICALAPFADRRGVG
jgi:energy-coupling factor transport system permease protein